MRRIDCWPYSSNNGELLSHSSSFEELLMKEFEKVKNSRREYEEWIKVIDGYFDSKRQTQDHFDLESEWHDLFWAKVGVDSVIAEKLHFLDILLADAFIYYGKEGDALYELICKLDLRFVVAHKTYGEHVMHLNFEVIHCDNERECLKKLKTGEFN